MPLPPLTIYGFLFYTTFISSAYFLIRTLPNIIGLGLNDTQDGSLRTMNIALWIVQGILAAGFIYSGWMKAFQHEKAKAAWPWAGEVPRGLVFFIGLAELIGALGLILPEATDAVPVLTPLAAIGLAAVVLLGAVFHAMRKEYREIGVNAAFLALAVLVAIGRQ